MKQFILKNKKVITGTIALLMTGAVTMSFQDSPFAYSKFSVQGDNAYPGNCSDTLPDKETMKMKDLEKLQTDLDKTLLQVNDELKKSDFTNLQKEIEASLKDIDMDKIRKNVELAIKSIDMDKMLAELSSSLKNLNLDHKSTEIEKALAEAGKEIEKAKLEINEIDKDVIKKELEKAKKEIEKSIAEISKTDMDKIIKEASAGIDKAKAALKETRNMFTEMEKEGLVNSKNGFTIEYKNKELYIDGKKQSKKTTDKYRKYFKQDHFKMTIDRE